MKLSIYHWLGIVILISFTALFTPVFIGDSALYGYIAKSFVVSENWSDIIISRQPWLDKPHFPFWVAGISIQLFGYNAIAYKAASLIFFLLTASYTYFIN